ncbi:MAG: deoxyribodipyrimidine photo-lyase [Pseudomonadota bacterium]|nr:deoxyribodipyrimidine photo-lyase [Pseudomonadota bacterium]
MNIVWFKRDLRVHDNLPLKAAANSGPFIPLYIYESELWNFAELGFRQRDFLFECLHSLNSELTVRGQPLVFRRGSCEHVFSSLMTQFKIFNVFSYEETWNDWTFKRDLALKKWFKKNKIVWQEFPRNGVVRGLKNRNDWSKQWKLRMQPKPVEAQKNFFHIEVGSDKIPKIESKKTPNFINLAEKLPGGRESGQIILDSFLKSRHYNYSRGISSPNTAFESSSRLSPYLAFGVFSIKEIVHAIQSSKDTYVDGPHVKVAAGKASMSSFLSRIKWHCHFMQKLEDQPEIEFNNIHSMTNKLDRVFNEEKFEAWKNGITGYPFVDACMRCLKHTGWINFRMRAMLMSFSSYHLWLPWQQSATYLASLFIDFEPGIHYPQSQMQSGTTGINAIRIYNPLKQSSDHDPNGVFVKRWVPELKNVEPEKFLKPAAIEKKIGYPYLIVDEKESRAKAAEKMHSLKHSETFKKEAEKIFLKHGSRKKISRNRKVSNVIKSQKSFEF